MTRMEPRHVRELGEALDYLIYGAGDEPLRCARCESTDVQRDYRDDALICGDCRGVTTMEVAASLRSERLRTRIRRGVGGPLVDHFRPENRL